MDKKILIIDIETTGFLKQGGSIVEIGIVELNLDTGQRKILFGSLCREKILTSAHRKHPFGWIFENSTLTVREVREAPSFESIKNVVQSIINDYTLGCTAFNRSFDVHFLKDRGFRFPLLQPCPMQVCTNVLKLAPTERMRKYKPNIRYKTPNVEEAYNFFFPSEESGYYIESHRAPDDAFHEAGIVYKLFVNGHYKLKTIGDPE